MSQCNSMAYLCTYCISLQASWTKQRTFAPLSKCAHLEGEQYRCVFFRSSNEATEDIAADALGKSCARLSERISSLSDTARVMNEPNSAGRR